jgi:hypothetical protein
MTAQGSGLSLAEGLWLTELNAEQLWLDYVALGGDAGQLEVEAYTLGILDPGPYQHNLIAQVLNEHVMASGGDHPVAYR